MWLEAAMEVDVKRAAKAAPSPVGSPAGKLSQAEFLPGHSYRVRKSWKTSLVIPYDRRILEKSVMAGMPRVCPTSRLRQVISFDLHQAMKVNTRLVRKQAWPL